MSHEEIMVHIDFSENYNTKYANEIQSVHFGASKQQISLHTGIAYLGDDKDFGLFKSWTGSHLSTFSPVIHFVNDGPTTQYRNKLNFYLWCIKVFDYGCTLSTCNFIEAAHGKGAADGVGAAVKRAADKQVHTYQQDITSGREFVANVQQCSSVMMFYVEEQSILPTSLKPLTDIMKIHQSHATHIVNPDCGAQIFDHNQTPIAYTDAHMIIADAVHTSKADAVQMYVTDAVHTPLTDARSSTGKSSSVDDVNKDEDTYSAKKNKTVFVVDSKTALVLQVEQKEDMYERLIGRYCIIDYDDLPYPGLILDIDEGAEVSAMCRIGANRFFWPLVEDRLWYGKEKIVALLETEPELATKRHRKLDDSMWKHIYDKLGLDNKGKK
ncbi:hypothetical protein MAR_009609 [Mya arenaria]|uniref:Uncharacterized protein n=1 Tax=Mya arenaria TaxID=6604 RepID=A0ABY7E268_MYAAR|nr:hypothetical protein MAR_009609 [Mya arenaria]